MTERSMQRTPTPPANDAVDSEVPCIGCGYLLRGLPVDGVCPECTTAVRRSLQGDQLIYADPRWLRVLVFGQSVFAGGITAIVITPILFVGYAVAGLRWDLPAWLDRVSSVLPTLGMLGIFAGAMIGTAQDPRDSERESPLSARRVARISLLSAALLTVLWYGTSHFSATAPYEPLITNVMRQIVLPALFAIGVMASLRWTHLLARRMRSDDLIRLTESAGKHFGWLVGIVIAYAQVKFVTGGQTPAWAEEGALHAIWAILSGVLSIAYLIAVLVLLFRMIRIAVIGVRMRADLARAAKAAAKIEAEIMAAAAAATNATSPSDGNRSPADDR